LFSNIKAHAQTAHAQFVYFHCGEFLASPSNANLSLKNKNLKQVELLPATAVGKIHAKLQHATAFVQLQPDTVAGDWKQLSPAAAPC
jgi:hypothetical protein